MSIWNVLLLSLIVAIWVLSNDLMVKDATRPDAGPLWFHIVTGSIGAALVPMSVVSHDWISVLTETIIVAMCARVIWHWWRRRRQGKPSRVLGLVTSLGHKLIVMPIKGVQS